MSRHNSPDTKRGPKLAELHSLDAPHLTAIEFPGKVVNVNKAVALLGGQATVSKVCLAQKFGHAMNITPNCRYLGLH